MILSDDRKVKDWGCSKCKGEASDGEAGDGEAGDGEDAANEAGDRLRILRNCDSESNENIAWEWMPKLRRCPWSQIDNDAWQCVRWWLEWKEFNCLPWGGNDLMEQPAYVLEALLICNEIKNKVEQAAETERIRKQGNGRRT